MGDVVKFTGWTKLDIDPDDVLTGPVGMLDEVLVIGRDNEGDLYVASHTADAGKIMLLIELGKAFILDKLQ